MRPGPRWREHPWRQLGTVQSAGFSQGGVVMGDKGTGTGKKAKKDKKAKSEKVGNRPHEKREAAANAK